MFSLRTISCSPEWERRALEKLLLADARERRAARRWRVIKTLLWMLLVAGLAAVMISQSQNAAPAGPHTAVISIRGEISSDSENNAEQLSWSRSGNVGCRTWMP